MKNIIEPIDQFHINISCIYKEFQNDMKKVNYQSYQE